jgi:hypothetical protein
MVFHLRDMVDTIGRKLIAGDVVELQHLKDYDALDGDVPAALKRYYVVGDASFAAEGFSQTWWPHLWRVKLNPLVDSQEYKDILDNIKAGPGTDTPVGQILSTYDKYININEAIVAQAKIDVPKSGYDTSTLYTIPTNSDGEPVSNPTRTDSTVVTADNSVITADISIPSPINKPSAYLSGDGLAPNCLPVGAGVAFPMSAQAGDFFLRLDYLPNRLFRYNGSNWKKIEDSVRTNITPGEDNITQRGSYVNNTNTFADSEGNVHSERQPLSRALTPKADN